MYDSVYGSIQPPGDLLWEKLEEAEIDNIKEFSDLFSRQVVERKPTKKKEEKPSKVQAMKILDSKRSQSVGILASSLHVDFSEIENGKLFCVTVHYDVLKEYNIVFLIFQNRIIWLVWDLNHEFYDFFVIVVPLYSDRLKLLCFSVRIP